MNDSPRASSSSLENSYRFRPPRLDPDIRNLSNSSIENSASRPMESGEHDKPNVEILDSDSLTGSVNIVSV